LGEDKASGARDLLFAPKGQVTFRKYPREKHNWAVSGAFTDLLFWGWEMHWDGEFYAVLPSPTPTGDTLLIAANFCCNTTRFLVCLRLLGIVYSVANGSA